MLTFSQRIGSLDRYDMRYESVLRNRHPKINFSEGNYHRKILLTYQPFTLSRVTFSAKNKFRRKLFQHRSWNVTATSVFLLLPQGPWLPRGRNPVVNVLRVKALVVSVRGRLHLRFECAVWMCVLRSNACHFWAFDTENDIENAFDRETHIQTAHSKRKCNRPLSGKKPHHAAVHGWGTIYWVAR
jgi:hypothetical protein